MTDPEPILGIDLGTSTSCVAVLDQEGPRVLADRKGRRIIPSVVAFRPDGELVGEEARPFLITDPESTVYSFKRIVGARVDDPQARTALSGFPYRLAEGPNRSVVVDIRGTVYSIPEVASRVLKRLKGIAEESLGQRVTKAVCAVPSTFNDAQRAATRIAGRIAGLDFIHVINEPTAAALAFGYDRREAQLLCVYDFGGGTFDFTVLEMEGQVFRVVGADGDPFLGGDDIDRAIALTAAELFRRQTGRHLWQEVAEWQRLLFECESAKRRLSEASQTVIRVRGVARTPQGEKDLVFPLTRQLFRQLSNDLLERSFLVCRGVLEAAGVRPGDVDAVILVGGTTLATAVRAGVASFFGQAPDVTVDPTEAVAKGAAIYGAAKTGQALPSAGPRRLLELSATAVAVRAGSHFQVLIGRNEPLPASETFSLTTTADGQRSFRLSVFQGRGQRPDDWGFVGDLIVEGLNPAPRGELSVAVTFTVNEQNRVSVTARDQASGREVNCRLGADRTASRPSAEVDDELRRYVQGEATPDEHPARRR